MFITKKNGNLRVGLRICRNILMVQFFCIGLVSLFSQTVKDKDETQYNYVIKQVHYNIKGSVTNAALDVKLDIQVGTVLKNLRDLNAYILDKKKLISNLRPLANMSTIVYTHSWNEELKQYDVEVFVYASSGWSILILPYFKYSDSSGLLLSARGRDYNFLGSLEPLALNIDYSINGSGVTEYGTSFNFQYPFKYKKHIFTLYTDESLAYQIENEKLLNSTGLKFGYSYALTPYIGLNTTIEQKFVTEKAPKFAFTYGQNTLQYGMSFKLNKNPIDIVNTITYSPSTRYVLTYPIAGNDTETKRSNSQIFLDNTISFGQYTWPYGGFFRQGFTASLGNSNEYNFKDNGYTINANIQTTAFYTYGNIFGINLRGYFIQNFFFYPDTVDIKTKGTGLGDRVRGVLDNQLDGSYTGFVLNFDMMFKLFQIRPLAEFHIGPLFDLAIRSRNYFTTFDIDRDFKATFGIEGLAHALFSNSIVIRGSYGIDIGEIIRTGTLTFANREIFIGLSLFY